MRFVAGLKGDRSVAFTKTLKVGVALVLICVFTAGVGRSTHSPLGGFAEGECYREAGSARVGGDGKETGCSEISALDKLHPWTVRRGVVDSQRRSDRQLPRWRRLRRRCMPRTSNPPERVTVPPIISLS